MLDLMQDGLAMSITDVALSYEHSCNAPVNATPEMVVAQAYHRMPNLARLPLEEEPLLARSAARAYHLFQSGIPFLSLPQVPYSLAFCDSASRFAFC